MCESTQRKATRQNLSKFAGEESCGVCCVLVCVVFWPVAEHSTDCQELMGNQFRRLIHHSLHSLSEHSSAGVCEHTHVMLMLFLCFCSGSKLQWSCITAFFMSLHIGSIKDLMFNHPVNRSALTIENEEMHDFNEISQCNFPIPILLLSNCELLYYNCVSKLKVY